ncbi:hypothetical protein [Mucilaginibacter conchicola]|uniref:hypothetical protein n=1 Tax=Mucilaginibacter conchicola TaxID=2303333 RepID=UPI0011C116B3|nr:hypothetical protein [Mucilaginibacter conchicola]
MPTNNIDTGVYKQLDKRFKVSAYKAPKHLGGLTPNYPIALGYQVLLDVENEASVQEEDWIEGGFISAARKILVKTPDDYVLINNRLELQKMYAPISTKQEALAYAILNRNGFAVFDDFYKRKKYRFVGKPAVSSVLEKNGHYIVKVFSYVSFGCYHPYYLETVQVDKDGSVKLLSKIKSFYDPADDSMCVD